MRVPQTCDIGGETWVRASDVIAYLLEVADWSDRNVPGPGYTGVTLRATAEKVSKTLV